VLDGGLLVAEAEAGARGVLPGHVGHHVAGDHLLCHLERLGETAALHVG
jgi:hypothetical protein